MPLTSGQAAPAPGRLRRVLRLPDLILYGIMVIMPIAPIPLFGVAQKLSDGHAVTTILIAMFAMLLTAVSYGRMASLYPVAGSAYTYVGRGLNAHLGFLAGWAMFLDYLIVPLLCTIYGALTVQRLVPGVPYAVLALLFAGGMTALNLRGIRSTTRANFVMLVVMCAVVGVFMVLALRQLYVGAGWGGVLSIQPFYDPATFRWQSILGGTSLETAYMDISRKVGGAALFQAMALVLVLANFGSGLGGQVGAARLLFGMGRDQVLPARPFAYVSPSNSNPTYNILLIGAAAFAGALVFDYEQAAETLNFGAFLAFMGVNLAALRQFYFLRPAGQRRIWETVLPAAGFLFCLTIWLGLRTPAKVVGGCWLLAGILYSAIKTRGFRLPPPAIRFDPEQDV